MKRRLIAAPTGLLLAGWLIGWGLQAMHQPMGTAWTAYAFTLLILYTILATFITSMADAIRESMVEQYRKNNFTGTCVRYQSF
ncbi:acetyltransferase [Lactiplantibacillus plantarum 2165]|nr:acetyltransferase [Lactiplantibacillus plantarum 2165]